VKRPVVVFVAISALAGACSSDGSGGDGSGRVRVVTTVSPVTNIVQNVAGGLVDVTGIVPPR
jgi:ABC-type Zn uptake system ZnuABC Zn-binding protein ZnuA